MSKIRVIWDLSTHEGHGEWFSPSDRPLLEKIVGSMNFKYGDGTHRIQSEDDLDNLQKEAEILVSKVKTPYPKSEFSLSN